jgi:hypothetical protein
MGLQGPKDVTRDTARDLSALVGELAALKGDATHWLTEPEYATLRHRLEAAHAAAEAALVEARSRVRLWTRGRASKGTLALARVMLHTFLVGRRNARCRQRRHPASEQRTS